MVGSPLCDEAANESKHAYLLAVLGSLVWHSIVVTHDPVVLQEEGQLLFNPDSGKYNLRDPAELSEVSKTSANHLAAQHSVPELDALVVDLRQEAPPSTLEDSRNGKRNHHMLIGSELLFRVAKTNEFLTFILLRNSTNAPIDHEEGIDLNDGHTA